jgi:chromosome segregation ATPase
LAFRNGAPPLTIADPSVSAEARLDAALARLTAALDQLDAAAQRRSALDAQRRDLVEELAVMQDDRARLAAELDGATARAQGLEAAQVEVGRRLARVGETLRAVIAAAETSE